MFRLVFQLLSNLYKVGYVVSVAADLSGQFEFSAFPT